MTSKKQFQEKDLLQEKKFVTAKIKFNPLRWLNTIRLMTLG